MREYTLRPDRLWARDAVLKDLGRQYDAATDRWNETRDALDDAFTATVYPEPPEALFWRTGDDDIGVLGPTYFRDGRAWYGEEVDLVARATPRRARYGSEDQLLGYEPDPAGVARVAEIVAAWKAWQADMAAAREAAGVTAADAAHKASAAATRSLMVQMTASPGHTLAGVMVKVRAIGLCFGGVPGLDDEIGEEPDGTAETLALAVVRDLLRQSSAPPAAPDAPAA